MESRQAVRTCSGLPSSPSQSPSLLRRNPNFVDTNACSRRPRRALPTISSFVNGPYAWELSEQPPHVTRSASAGAVEVMRQGIAEGLLEPGERLKEEELAREFGISRTPIREALLVFQAEGLVAVAANRGASVRSYRADEL